MANSDAERRYRDPESRRAKLREYQRAYRARPEVREKERAYHREYRLRPIPREKERERHARPEIVEKRRERARRPEVKARKRETGRARLQWVKYGITQAHWERIFQAQGQVCAVCKTDAPGRRGWVTDHDHGTGVVRGILCLKCNAALGMIGDSLEALRRWAPVAERYLLAAIDGPTIGTTPPKRRRKK